MGSIRNSSKPNVGILLNDGRFKSILFLSIFILLLFFSFFNFQHGMLPAKTIIEPYPRIQKLIRVACPLDHVHQKTEVCHDNESFR